MEFEEFKARLVDPVEQPSGVSSRCPGHPDRVRSMMSNPGERGGVVVKCHAGCKVEDIVVAMGLTMADLMGKPYRVAGYVYQDHDGNPLWTVERWANPKKFFCVPELPPPAERVLFQLPAIDWARANGKPLFICEGEKDCLRLAELGIPATCNVTGAGKWLPHYTTELTGLDVVVVADNDPPGVAHARHVAGEAKTAARSVTVVRSPYGKDISDLLDAGYGVEALELLPEADELQVFIASSITPRKVSWAWSGYIPSGKLVMIEGDPGDGKSLLTLDLAARFTTGTPMPDGSAGIGPVNVVLISAEDDLADTIAPRLRMAGANMERIHLLESGAAADQPFNLVSDLPALARYLIKCEARVLVIDPLSAFLGERIDTHNDASVRRGLHPLKLLAGQTGVVIIVVRHLNKASGGKAIYRGGGSIAFTGAARMSFLVAPSNEDPEVKVFACVKSNLARKPASLTYTVKAADDIPYVEWGETIAATAQELLDGPERRGDQDGEESLGRQRARQEERAFLVDLLKGEGPLSWNDIVIAGKAEGFSDRSLRRARTEVMSVESFRETVDGQTSTKWRTKPTVDAIMNLEPSNPLGHLATSSESQAGAQNAGQVAKSSLNGHREVSSDDLSEDAKDDALRSTPNDCDVCGHSPSPKWFKPWWVTRCKAHNPLQYHTG